MSAFNGPAFFGAAFGGGGGGGGGGALTLLGASVVSSDVASVDFTELFSSTYRTYLFTGVDVVPDNATDRNLSVRFRRVGGSFDATASNYHRGGRTISEVPTETVLGGTATGWPVAITIDNAGKCSFRCWIYDPEAAAAEIMGTVNAVFSQPGGGTPIHHSSFGFDYLTGSEVLDGVQLAATSDLISAGRFALYGLAEA